MSKKSFLIELLGYVIKTDGKPLSKDEKEELAEKVLNDHTSSTVILNTESKNHL